jgi:prepilin-type N-terminal cleavage/methylation domain-containing protein
MQKQNRGFSLIELLIVVAIIAVLAALALPTILTAIENMKLQQTLSSYAQLQREARTAAIRSNRMVTIWLWWDAPTQQLIYYADLDGDFQLDSTEPQFMPPRSTWLQFGGAPSSASMNLPNVPQVFFPISYNSRGVLCQWNGANSCLNAGAVRHEIYFYNHRGNFVPVAWGAVTVVPGGRTKSWLWGGTSWQSR